MQLKNLSVGQKFKFAEGNGKIWKKLSNNGDIATYNVCVCLDNLRPEQKIGLMIIDSTQRKLMNKEANVIIVN